VTGLKEKATAEEIEYLLSYIQHQSIARRRAIDFNKQIQYLKPGEVIVVADFKANMTLGLAAEDTDDVFFNAPQISVFGIVIAFRTEGSLHFICLMFHLYILVLEGTKIQYQTFCYLVESLIHDTAVVIKCFEQMMTTPRFLQHGFHTIHVWSDNGIVVFHSFFTSFIHIQQQQDHIIFVHMNGYVGLLNKLPKQQQSGH